MGRPQSGAAALAAGGGTCDRRAGHRPAL